MTAHRTILVQEGLVWRATCTCGWQSACTYSTTNRAQREARAHLAQLRGKGLTSLEGGSTS